MWTDRLRAGRLHWTGARSRSARTRSARTLPLAALLASVALSGCIDLVSVGDIAFPRLVPGLRADQPWVSMPVGAWMTEGGVEPKAISACFAAGCEPRAAVALFVATGPDAAELDRILADPQLVARLLQERAAERTVAAPRRRATPRIASSVEVERRQEGDLSGFVLRLARRDGSRQATGYVLAARRTTGLSLVIVIAATEDAARRIARDVAPHLG